MTQAIFLQSQSANTIKWASFGVGLVTLIALGAILTANHANISTFMDKSSWIYVGALGGATLVCMIAFTALQIAQKCAKKAPKSPPQAQSQPLSPPQPLQPLPVAQPPILPVIQPPTLPQQVLPQPTIAPPKPHHVTQAMFDQLKASQAPIENGYGEYLVYYKGAAPRKLSKATYDEAYTLINSYNYNINVSGDKSKLIQAELQKIDPDLELAFVPRTLYDLIFIRASIEEDLQAQHVCSLQQNFWYNVFKEQLEDPAKQHHAEKQLNNCYHICKFNEHNPATNEHPLIKQLAYRINELIVDKYQPKGFFTGSQIAQMIEEQVEFFKKYRADFQQLTDSGTFRIDNMDRGPSINFGIDESFALRETCYPMGIKDDQVSQIIYNAVGLECNTQNALIFYRAGDAQKDKKIAPDDLIGKSLSFSTSLFSGGMLDATATTAYYTILNKRDTYCVVVPYDQYPTGPYYYPLDKSHSICQLNYEGEFWHARTYIPSDPHQQRVAGVFGGKQIPPRALLNTSLSYSTSMLSGSLHDATASTFYYTIRRGRGTYAIVIPYQEYADSPYHYPSSNALCQLTSGEEFFHGRTKITKDSLAEKISGISGYTRKEIPPFLFSPLDSEAYSPLLNKYQETLIPLTV